MKITFSNAFFTDNDLNKSSLIRHFSVSSYLSSPFLASPSTISLLLPTIPITLSPSHFTHVLHNKAGSPHHNTQTYFLYWLAPTTAILLSSLTNSMPPFSPSTPSHHSIQKSHPSSHNHNVPSLRLIPTPHTTPKHPTNLYLCFPNHSHPFTSS